EQKRNAEDESRRANALARTVRVRAAQFALQRGLALCERGENGVGLTWLANALEQTPEDERSLREVVQMQLAAWNQLRLLLQHPPTVNCAAFSPDGSVIVTGCRDGTVRFWDAATGQSRFHTLIHDARGGREGVTSVGFHSKGGIVATGTSDGIARLWDIRSGR